MTQQFVVTMIADICLVASTFCLGAKTLLCMDDQTGVRGLEGVLYLELQGVVFTRALLLLLSSIGLSAMYGMCGLWYPGPVWFLAWAGVGMVYLWFHFARWSIRHAFDVAFDRARELNELEHLEGDVVALPLVSNFNVLEARVAGAMKSLLLSKYVIERLGADLCVGARIYIFFRRGQDADSPAINVEEVFVIDKE